MIHNHKWVLQLLLEGKTITVFKEDIGDSNGGIALRLDGDYISAYFYNPITGLQQQYTEFSLIQLLNGYYKFYREGNVLGGYSNFKPTHEFREISDKQFMLDLIDSECLHYDIGDLKYVMGLDCSGRFFSMTLEEWRHQKLSKFADQSSRSYPEVVSGKYLRSDTIEKLLTGSAIMLKEIGTLSVTAYQLNGVNIEAFVLNTDTLTWYRDSTKGLRDLLNTCCIKMSIIETITDYATDTVSSNKLRTNVTDRKAIHILIKEGELICRTKDTLEVFTNSSMRPIETCNWLPWSSDYDIEFITKKELNFITKFDNTKFNLIVNDRIDVGHLSEDEFIEKINSRLEHYADKRLKQIFFGRYEFSGNECKTFKQIGIDLKISTERVRQILARGLISLRRYWKEDLPQLVPPTEEKLDISIMHFYTGVIAGIY